MTFAHRYWRVRSTLTWLGNYMACTELELRATTGGADQCSGGTASASLENSAPYVASMAFDNNNTTFWTTGGTAPGALGHWIKYDFGAGNEKVVQEISYKSRIDGAREDPKNLYIEFSDDNVNWIEQWSVTGILAWTAGEVRVYLDPSIGDLSAGAAITQAHVRTIHGEDAAPEGRVDQAHVRALISLPSVGGGASSLMARNLWAGTGGLLGVADQLAARILIKFGLDSRKLRAWTFTQDDHDFWVLQLGGALTFVYDKLTQAWAQWKSPGYDYWRGSDGVQWEGWNVTCDTESGIIWEIDADGRLDAGVTPITSVMYGGFTKRFRAEDPCYMAELALSEGQPPSGVDAGDVGITLRTSDDGGVNYINHGEIPSEAIGADITVRWYGLGLMNHPNKIFEITDTGYARRIDGLDVEVKGG